jgi:hypothetical protein
MSVCCIGLESAYRSVTVDEGTESQTVVEGRREVLHVHIAVGLGLALAPQQEALLGGHTLLAQAGDGETENNGP